VRNPASDPYDAPVGDRVGGGDGQDGEGAERFLVVSVHDVASSNGADVRWLLEQLDRLGVGRRVLMVVPRWKSRERLADDPALVDLLAAEARRGSEIVVHGLTHAARGRFLGAWTQRVRARLFAPRDAEFATLTRDAAAAAAETARADLAAVGLTARGFCPPGWIGGPGLDVALNAHDFDYSIWFAGLTDLRRGRHVRAPAIGYMGAGRGQERLVSLDNWLVTGWPLPARVLRVYLHPQGSRRAPECAAILRRLPGLAGERTLATYADVLR
jgi:predicted deacetylase